MVDQPFSVNRLYDAQVSVLGSMLIDPDIVGEAMTAVREDDFTDPVCRRMFDAFRKLYFANKPIDSVTVFAEMGKEYHETIKNFMLVTPTSANWKLYADIMREQATLQRIQTIGGQLAEVSDAEAAAALMDRLNAVFCARPRVRAMSFQDGLARFYERHTSEKKVNYLGWGYSALDERLYAEGGDFIVIGGRPSAGKTLLACSFAWTMALRQNKRVGIFSLETKDEKLYDRLICRASGASFSEIKKSNISAESWEKISDLGDLGDVPLVVHDAAGMTVQDIKALSLANRYDVIFIDYIQKIKVPRRQSRAEEVSDISSSLQAFARSTNITVVALSQLSRAKKDERNKPPTLEDLRESGQIEQDGDIIMLLYAVDFDVPASDRRLRIAKNKDGELGYLTFKFEPEAMLFTYRTDRIEPPPKRSSPKPTQVRFWDLEASTPIEEVFPRGKEQVGFNSDG